MSEVGIIIEPQVVIIIQPHVGIIIEPHVGIIIEPHVGTINLMRLVTVRSVEGENLISYPTEFIALIDPSPVTGLVNLEKRIGTRSLIFQWNPPNGHFDNYFIQWERNG